MAAAPATPCLSELAGPPSSPNVSLMGGGGGGGGRPCNRSAARRPPYTPQATAAFAASITSMMLLTIVGNVLVIMAVLTSRSLRGAQNLFLVSLAAADILVATLIIPFSLANELQGFWAFGAAWCQIYLALDVLFCTSSIVHLCAIALDRYLSISRPVSYGARRSPGRVGAAVVVVWLISAVISFPPLLTLDHSAGGQEVCELNSERWYILYSTIGSFFAPCVIMVLVYVRIYQIAKRHTRRAAAGPGPGPQAPGGRNPGSATTDPPGKTSEDPPEDVPGQKPDQDALEDSAPRPGPAPETGPGAPSLSRRYRTTVVTPSGARLAPEESCRSPGTPVSRRKAVTKREKRFTVVLAVVMGVFVLCWFPFFLSYSLQAVCPASCAVPAALFKFFFWIGYCNSCLNPVIYTAFNHDFRKAFKRILCRDAKGTSL